MTAHHLSLNCIDVAREYLPHRDVIVACLGTKQLAATPYPMPRTAQHFHQRRLSRARNLFFSRCVHIWPRNLQPARHLQDAGTRNPRRAAGTASHLPEASQRSLPPPSPSSLRTDHRMIVHPMSLQVHVHARTCTPQSCTCMCGRRTGRCV